MKKTLTAMAIATSVAQIPNTADALINDNHNNNIEPSNSQSDLHILESNQISEEIVKTRSSSVGTVINTDSLNIRLTPNTSKAPIGKLKRGDKVQVLSKYSSSWYKINYQGQIGYVSSKYIKLSPDYTISALNAKGKVINIKTNDTLNVREGAGTDFKSLFKLKLNTEIKITGLTSNGWYQINYSNTTAYVSKNYVQIIEDSNPSVPDTPSNPSTPESDGISTSKYIVTSDINLRKEASWSSSIVKTVKKNTELNVISINGDWAKVLNNGQIVYAPSNYLKLVENQSTSKPTIKTYTYKTTNAINLRNSASWSGKVIRTVQKNTLLKVISINDAWAQVLEGENIVYAPSSYLIKIDSEPEIDNTPSIPDTPTTPDIPNTPNVPDASDKEENKPELISGKYQTTSAVNLRKEASWSSNVIKTISKNEIVDVISIENDWAKVLYQNDYGYIPSMYLIKVEDSSSNPDENVPSEPEEDAPSEPEEDAPSKPEEDTGNNPGEDVVVPDTPIIPPNDAPSEDIPSEPVIPDEPPVSETEYKEYIVTADINLRLNPSWSSEILRVSKKGEVLKVISIDGAWAKILLDNQNVFAPATYLKLKELDNVFEIDEKGYVCNVASNDTLNVRELPNTSSNILIELKNNTDVRIIGKTNDGWYRIVVDNIIGYVSEYYIQTYNLKTPAESTTYTKYDYTLKEYVIAQSDRNAKYSPDYFEEYINPSKGDTYEFLKLNEYRDININKLNALLESKNAGVLKGQGQSIANTAKKYNIDPLYFVSQSMHETGYGKSTLAKGVTISEIADTSKPILNENGDITGYEMIPLETPVTVYNLYGIGAHDNLPTMPNRALILGTTHAYNNGWTSVENAIDGAGAFVSSNYINSSKYNQDTLYKIRYNPSKTYIWHQYATSPWYSRSIAETMRSFDSIYKEDVTFSYDVPQFIGGNIYKSSNSSSVLVNNEIKNIREDIVLVKP